MKLNSKKVIPVAIVTGVAALALAGANFASAATSGDTLVDRIASKFNLNKTDVQKVFDDFKGEKEAEREKVFSDRLQAVVDEGKITADQKTLIENKLAEEKQKMDDLRNQSLTEDQRRQKMEELRTDLEKWATDNKIDLKYLRPFGKGMGRGMMGGREFGAKF